jgi:phosphoribosyl-AMP cyclohydrolase
MNLIEKLNWGKDDLMPIVVADFETKRALVLCFVDKEALRLTLETGKVHTYSRSRGRVALKGESSGHFQIVKRVLVNCNEDSLCIEVEQREAACHMGYFSCYYREADPETGEFKVIAERVFDPDDVYGK